MGGGLGLFIAAELRAKQPLFVPLLIQFNMFPWTKMNQMVKRVWNACCDFLRSTNEGKNNKIIPTHDLITSQLFGL